MAWADVGYGLRGAVDTFADLYKFGKDQETQGRQLDQRAALADQKNQVALFLQELKNLGLLNVQDAKNEGGANIATINQTGATDRTRLTEDGRNTRFAQGDATTRLLGGMRDRTTQRGQDLGFEAAGMRDRTARRGQNVGFSIAGMRDETTRRGQDLDRATATDRLMSGAFEGYVPDIVDDTTGDPIEPGPRMSSVGIPLQSAAPVPVPIATPPTVPIPLAGQPSALRPKVGRVTQAERSTLGFADRLRAAVDDLSAVEDAVANQGLLGQLWGESAPNALQTETQQLYRQAQRMFTEARLRKESGAAIPESEFENDHKMFFVQPGDSPKVIEQKRKRREDVARSFLSQAPNAVREQGRTTPTAATPTRKYQILKVE